MRRSQPSPPHTLPDRRSPPHGCRHPPRTPHRRCTPPRCSRSPSGCGAYGAAEPRRDEAVTYAMARRSLPDLWSTLADADAVHGLYYLLMHLLFEVTCGLDLLLVLRLPSVLATVAATGTLALLGHRLAGPRAGLLADRLRTAAAGPAVRAGGPVVRDRVRAGRVGDVSAGAGGGAPGRSHLGRLHRGAGGGRAAARVRRTGDHRARGRRAARARRAWLGRRRWSSSRWRRSPC